MYHSIPTCTNIPYTAPHISTYIKRLPPSHIRIRGLFWCRAAFATSYLIRGPGFTPTYSFFISPDTSQDLGFSHYEIWTLYYWEIFYLRKVIYQRVRKLLEAEKFSIFYAVNKGIFESNKECYWKLFVFFFCCFGKYQLLCEIVKQQEAIAQQIHLITTS